MCDTDFLCSLWPIISIIGLILGIWVGGLVVFFLLKKYINGDKEKDNKIRTLIDTKNNLIKILREQDEEIELRDKELLSALLEGTEDDIRN